MAGVRVEIDEVAIVQLGRRGDVVDAVRDRVEKIADAARARGITVDGEPGDIPVPIETDVTIDGNTARGVVYIPHAAGLAVEAKHRLLVGSIDAAR